MPCEITIYDSRGETLCPHPSISHCSDCHAELCSAHCIECDVCRHFICSDCIISHRYSHDLEEQKLKARAS